MKSSRLEGRAEGLTEGIKKTALSMLADSMPVSTISKYTGLSILEINSLKSKF
jgi:predicted transposase YdaD